MPMNGDHVRLGHAWSGLGCTQFDAYPSVTRPDGVLGLSEFAYIQRREAPQLLHDLAIRCWRRYRYALLLTRPADPVADPFDTRPYPDLAPLLPAWDRLCCWYRDTLFDRQLDLFGCPWNDELARWHGFVRHRCVDVILDRPDWVRLVMQSLAILPSVLRHAADLTEGERLFVTACFDAIILANMENHHAC